MKASLSFLLVIIAFAQADVDWSKVTPIHIGPDVHVARNGGLRIVGGDESIPHSRPYQVGLLLPLQDREGFCGGSLISKRTVLTAAHCVYQLTGSVTVILGAHNIEENEASQFKIVSNKIIIHPQWNPDNFQNDIALIILPEEAPINGFIQTINIPEKGSAASYEGEQAIVSGWGKDSDSSNQISSVLREVTIPIITNSLCNDSYFGGIVESHICASGSGGKSSCNGDSGGPFVVNGVQVGVVSFGVILGCEIGWPSVYTRLTSFGDFIRSNQV